MTPVEILKAGVALVIAVNIGTVAHELSHAIVLRAVGVSYDLVWFGRSRGMRSPFADLFGGSTSVRLRHIPADLPRWKLRTAALMPFLLATPVLLVTVGVVPNPFQTGNLPLTAALIGWLACGLPSPQDFSTVWYPDRVISQASDEDPASVDHERAR